MPASTTVKGSEIDSERTDPRFVADADDNGATVKADGAAIADSAAEPAANGGSYDGDLDGLLGDGPAFPPSSRAAEPPVVPHGEVERLISEALAQRAASDDHAAAETLRTAIMQASRAGDRRGHARARLELGDIAQAEGDLITACEHWQMARSLYEEEDRPGEAEQCGSRMLKNGCPTDWVLTDF